MVTLYSPPADREFIEGRRRALKRFINLVARHPPFSEDVLLKLFLSFSGSVRVSLGPVRGGILGSESLAAFCFYLRPGCSLRLTQPGLMLETVLLTQPPKFWEPMPRFYSVNLCYFSCLLSLV